MADVTLNELIEDSSCLNCLSESEKQAAFIYYTAKSLFGLQGGTDYSDLNTLRDRMVCWCVGGQVLDSMKVRTAINSAVANGGIEGTPTIAEVREAIRCWNCGIGGGELKAMEVFLLYYLIGPQPVE